MSDACCVEECEDVISVCCDESVLRVRASLRSEVSASRRRRSRACCRVERDSERREMAVLSGAMLKLEMVWRISWGVLLVLGGVLWELVLRGKARGTDCGGVFFEEHFGGWCAWVWVKALC
jgi:hypothetical protein